MSVEISRRGFLRGFALFAAARPVASYAAARGLGAPNVAFGVLSDVHICCLPYMQRFIKEPAKYARMRDTALLEKAFTYFRDSGADGVAIAGDIADWGLVGQMKLVAATWNKVFPAGKGKDGRAVQRLFALGNHDFQGWRYGYAKEARGDLPLPKEEILAADMAGNWQKIFGEKYEPIWMKSVKGYRFVGAHWESAKGIHALAPWAKAHADALSGDKPFFYFQHAQPKNTCLGNWIWGHDDGCATKVLSKFPNAVAFSGHSHKPLTSELNVWQGAFTSIGTASLFSMGHPVGRDNASGALDLNPRGLMKGDGTRRKQKTLAAHGQFVRVYDDFIEIERIEFVSGEKVGPNIVIPLPVTKEKLFLFATQAERATEPAPFPAGAKVVVERAEAPLRGEPKPQPVFVIKFPQTRRVAGASRTADYEITVETTEMDVTETRLTRYVTSPNDFYPEGTKKGPVTFILPAHLIPRGLSFRIGVRARETFGKMNAPIWSSPLRG